MSIPMPKIPITPHIPGGHTTPEQLRHIAAVAEKYGGKLKIVGSTISITGLRPDDGKKTLAELGCKLESFTAKSVRAVAMCPGKPDCLRAQQDSTTLGLSLDTQFFGRPMPSKVRIGISGCPNCCSEPVVKDIGLYGLPKGFVLTVGGNAGRLAKAGTIVGQNIPAEKAAAIIEAILAWYNEHGRDKERLGHTVERIGLAEFIEQVIPPEYRQ